MLDINLIREKPKEIQKAALVKIDTRIDQLSASCALTMAARRHESKIKNEGKKYCQCLQLRGPETYKKAKRVGANGAPRQAPAPSGFRPGRGKRSQDKRCS